MLNRPRAYSRSPPTGAARPAAAAAGYIASEREQLRLPAGGQQGAPVVLAPKRKGGPDDGDFQEESDMSRSSLSQVCAQCPVLEHSMHAARSVQQACLPPPRQLLPCAHNCTSAVGCPSTAVHDTPASRSSHSHHCACLQERRRNGGGSRRRQADASDPSDEQDAYESASGT